MCTTTPSAPESAGITARSNASPRPTFERESNVRTDTPVRPPHRLARDDSELVDAGRKRVDELDRLRKRRMVRVECLRDEDELHQRAPASTRSTSDRYDAAKSSAVWCHPP